MEPYILLVPFVLLIPVNGMQIYMLELALDRLANQALPGKLVHRLQRFKASAIPWYIWLLREVKDWSLAGILGGIGVGYLTVLVAEVIMWLFALLTLALLVELALTLVLFLFLFELPVPGFLLRWAVGTALPDLVPANRRRAGFWGLAFLLTASACLAVWLTINYTGALVVGFITCALGILSLLQAFFAGQIGNGEAR